MPAATVREEEGLHAAVSCKMDARRPVVNDGEGAGLQALLSDEIIPTFQTKEQKAGEQCLSAVTLCSRSGIQIVREHTE